MLSRALTEVVIPSYNLSAPAPYFFKREYAVNETENWDTRMALVARATSAAPTYFDPAVIPSPDGNGKQALVDGGTFANNPTLSGYVDALRLKEEKPRVVVVSIGTGLPPQTPSSTSIASWREPGHRTSRACDTQSGGQIRHRALQPDVRALISEPGFRRSSCTT